MDPITAAEFRTRYPEFSDSGVYPDSVVNMHITDLHDTEVGFSEFGRYYEQAIAALVAHRIELSNLRTSNRGGGATPLKDIASQSEGGVSESYVAASATSQRATDADGLYRTTQYGQQFLHLRGLAIIPAGSTGQITPLVIGRRRDIANIRRY